VRDEDLFEEIIDLGKRQGVLSCNDINIAFPSEFVSQDEMEDLLDRLHDMGIKVTEDHETDIAGEEVTEEKERHEKAEDLVQAYFQSMGDIPVLLKNEETDLARRIEEGNEIIRRIVTVMPLYKDLLKKADRQSQGQEDVPDLEEDTEAAIGKCFVILDNLMRDVKISERNACFGSVRDPERLTEKSFCITEEVHDIYSRVESETGISIGELKEKYEQINRAGKLISEAKDELITHNLRLVVNIAKHYIGRGLSLLDLIQEGNIGLMKAVDKFDYRRGFKFSTYATWWIRQAIARALIDQTKTIRIPVHMVDFYNRVNHISKELTQKFGREPRTEEIAQELKVPRSKIEDVLRAIQDPITLHTPVGNDESTLEDFIGDDSASPYADAVRNGLTEQIIEVLQTLSPKEEKVIRMRFGIGVDRDYTLEEVGRSLSITRERVRQIETKALWKLRHPERLRALRVLNTA
jgi:RNA polymerase primary sigma factor